MSYEKQNWIDHIEDAETGEIFQEGTLFTAKRMNHMEEGIYEANSNLSLSPIFNLKSVYNAKCVGGNTDDTTAIQNFINDLKADGKGGVIQLPPGEIRLDGLTFNSSNSFSTYNNRLTIRGSGINSTTLICDEDSNDIFLDFQGFYNDAGNRKQCAFINIENLKIKCTASTNKLAINYNVTQYCDLTNVWIENFKDGAIRFEDSYDSNFYNVQIIKSGRATDETDYAPAIGIYGNHDCSNALHFTNCRLEFLPIFIRGTALDDIGASFRHVYFDNCKFEKMSFNNISACRPIDLEYHNECGFNNCMFVNSCEYSDTEYLCDSGKHFMKLNYDKSTYVSNNNQIRSTKFSNCHFICPSNTWSNWGAFIGCHFINTDFNNCYGMADHTQCFYLNGENVFDNVNISSKGSKLFAIDGDSNILNIPKLQLTDTSQSMIRLFANANYNKININIQSGGDFTADYISLNDTTTDFLQNNKIGRWYLKNNVFNIGNKDSTKEITANSGNVCNISDIVYYNAAQLNYLSYGYNRQRFLLKAVQDVLIVHDGNYIYLKDKADKTLYTDDYILLENINGVWYEV